ncbi:MAG: hypothetical protein H7Z13_13700 [Ferruginibacter sp.]|nr:hypothetical protein [Ferruginibacter sp.]
MKYLLVILSIVFVLPACNKTNKELKKRIINADSVAINYFKGDGTMDTVVAIKIIRDKQKIEQLATFIAERSAEGDDSCGYDGSLHFFKMNRVVQDVDFRMNAADCMNFYFLQDGKTQTAVLSPEAKELIISLRQ